MGDSLLNNFLSRRLLAKSRRLSFFMSFADDIQRIAHPGRASFQYFTTKYRALKSVMNSRVQDVK
jgi:hypothetical protein